MVKIIDSHVHLWELQRGDYAWITPELKAIYRDFRADELQQNLRSANIDAAILVQCAPTLAETDYLLALANELPFIAGVVGWVDFADEQAAAQISRLAREPKLVGLRPMIQDINHNNWMLRRELAPAFNALLEHKLCFDALVLPQHLDNLYILLTRYPELKVVIDHAAKPLIAQQQKNPWQQQIERCAQQPQVFCKLSGLITEAVPHWEIDDLYFYVKHLIHIFGEKRLMWGSDWPVVNLAGDYATWLAAAKHLLRELDAKSQQAIFADTALQFYGVKS